MTESGGGILGKGAASPSPHWLGGLGALKAPDSTPHAPPVIFGIGGHYA